MTAGLAVFLILIWGGFLEFISPALPGTTTEQAIIPSAGWSPASMIPGLGVAIAGWAVAFYFHLFPAHPSAWLSERKKTLYVFFLNRGYFDEVYEVLIVRPTLRFASWLWRVVDGGINRTYMATAGASADLARWLWRVVDGGIDRAYMTAAGASADLARALWERVDVRLIDRPADRLADASFKMAARLTKVVDLKKAGEQRVSYVLLMLLVLLMILLVLAGGIVFLFLRIVA